jgi:hypothetical protein
MVTFDEKTRAVKSRAIVPLNMFPFLSPINNVDAVSFIYFLCVLALWTKQVFCLLSNVFYSSALSIHMHLYSFYV